MNIDFATRILTRIGKNDPPGCCGTFLEHPFPPYRRQQAVEIGFVIEHRFAFYYWLKCKHKLMTDRHTHHRPSDEGFRPPDLITWDWHDDVGAECDFIEEELTALDQANEQEVALFCWAGLRQLNDGHIAPALWLNALGNVYVLQKQRDMDDCDDSSRPLADRYGREHNIWFFRSPKALADHFDESNSGTGVIWDVDLDFFTAEEEVPDQRYTPPMTKRAIRSLLNPKNLWMQHILSDLRAITIAIEPEYTGGLSQSLDLFRIWETALFAKPIFSKACRWRDNLFDIGRP